MAASSTAEPSTPELVSLTIEPPVAVVRLERPDKLNAFTYRMIADFRRAVDAAIREDRVFGIVVTGAGRAFSAGLDMDDLGRSASVGAPSAGGDDRDERAP